jgi:TM2 domain-containing membrane protein YozV
VFCSHCGKEVSNQAMACPGCAQSFPGKSDPDSSPKNRTLMILLIWFLGPFGIHRFYAGKAGTGLLQLLIFCVVIFSIIYAPVDFFIKLIRLDFTYPMFYYFLLLIMAAGVEMIWWLYDFIMACCGLFTDNEGRKITQWDL